mgnify:CR=1 FL=1
MARNVEERIESMLIVGKNSTRRRLVFHTVEDFFLAVSPTRDNTDTTYVLPVPEETYLGFSVGELLDVPQYSANGKQWYFSQEEAEKYTPITIGVVFGRG